MNYYNLDEKDEFAGFTWTIKVGRVDKTFIAKISVKDYFAWEGLAGTNHLTQTLERLDDIIPNAVALATIDTIRIQLLDTPREKGHLLIGAAGATRFRTVTEQLDDDIDGIRGDLYRYRHVNTGELVRSTRDIDHALRFYPENGPIVTMVDQMEWANTSVDF